MDNRKYLCFEYLLYQLISWYNEYKPTDSEYLSFTRLKVLKLLFFVSAIRVNEDDLLDIFDNFWAMQHGPVESDIYNAMMQNRFEFYSFKNRSISNKKIFEYNKVCKEIGELKAKLDASINQLKLINPNMVLMTAFELVELSHRWRSWKLAMYIANLNDKGSSRIDVSDIRNYPQFFVL